MNTKRVVLETEVCRPKIRIPETDFPSYLLVEFLQSANINI